MTEYTFHRGIPVPVPEVLRDPVEPAEGVVLDDQPNPVVS